VREILLTRGYIALVDDADYDRVMAAGPWCAKVTRNDIYAMRNVRRPGGKGGGTQMLHRFILGLSGSVLVDHRNRYGLDNRRGNLRIGVTRSQNNANSGKHRGAFTSRFRGVCWKKKKWCAQIVRSGKKVHLGYFTEELDAARAYDAAAREQWGEFAKSNLGQNPAKKREI